MNIETVNRQHPVQSFFVNTVSVNLIQEDHKISVQFLAEMLNVSY